MKRGDKSRNTVIREEGEPLIETASRPSPVAADAVPVVLVEDETQESGGIDLLALVVSFLSQWRLGASVAVVVAVICTVYILRLKPQYVATASILPQEGRSSDTLASLFATRGAGTLYIGLLRSRTVQDLVIDRAQLLQIYHVTDRQVARSLLDKTSTFAETGNGLMDVSVRDGDANTAALIANAYLDALQELNESMGLQQSTRTREFFEQQLQQERMQLANAEGRYKQLQQKTGLVLPDTQIASGLNTIQTTRQQIQTLEVERAGLRQSETEQNPQLVALNSRIAQLEAEERQQESSGPASPIGAAPSASQALQQTLDLQRAQRDVTYYSGLVTSLGNEFETARMNEIAARSAFQIVDRAIPPENKAWPPRKPYFAISLAFSVILGLLAIIGRLLSIQALAHAATREHLRTLRSAFR